MKSMFVFIGKLASLKDFNRLRFNRLILPYFNTFNISFLLRGFPTFHVQHEPSIVLKGNKRCKLTNDGCNEQLFVNVPYRS